MFKKCVFTMIIFCITVSMVFAKKRIDSKTLTAEDEINSWQEKFDVNDKKNGKYNIIVTAEDQAGNESVTGPFNIYIDAESDLPVTGITNPVEQMRVPGNLNIVGTCIDDDKVQEVWLVLDGDEENPVKAQGTEFWSYYLDTTQLLEGPHTIEVYGIDDGNPDAYIGEDGKVDKEKVVPKTGHRAKVTWQLDRRVPVTTVTSPENMGALVSGKVKIEGFVTDGNGIKSLEYSLDGTHFTQVSLKEEKFKERDPDGLLSRYNFSFSIDTTKFKDGAMNCYFKATDNAGSIGRFAFLFLIDNTKPDVKIITPKEKEAANGTFTVAGYAKDIIGIESLKWKWGSEEGNFELIPGNPYWVKEVTAPKDKKSEVFTVIATDTIGNNVVVTREIPLNHEADKPVVSIKYPANGVSVEGEDGTLFLRGVATDDDGVVSVTYKLDDSEEKTLDCTGVFYAPIEGSLEYGNHTITVYGTDRYGVKGNKVTSTFKSKGIAPSFKNPLYKGEAFKDGMVINPEADGTFEVTAFSSSGLKSVSYEINWGASGSKKEEVPVVTAGTNSISVKVPLKGDDLPWGISKLTVSATDVYERTSAKTYLLNILDLTKTTADFAGVVFEDSTVGNDGGVFANPDMPLTGYFVGGKIQSVSISPAIRGVSATFEDNLISVSSSAATSNFQVKVTTDAGTVYSSQNLYFYIDEKPPVIKLDSEDTYNSVFKFVNKSDKLKVSGTVSGDGDLSLTYRLFTVYTDINDDGVIYSITDVNKSDWKKDGMSLDRRGRFSFEKGSEDLFGENGKGFSVIELKATSSNGKTSAQAIFVKNIPYAPVLVDENGAPKKDKNGKNLSLASPKAFIIEGEDYYGIGVYQGTLDKEFSYVRRNEITAEQNKLSFSVSTVDSVKKLTDSKTIDISVPVEISGQFVKVDNVKYKSGLPFVLERGTLKEAGHVATVQIKANAGISRIDYIISGDKNRADGGDVLSKGQVVPRVIKEGELYEADIPLANLPARLTNIKVCVFGAKGGYGEITGTVSILRTHNITDSSGKIYWAAIDNAEYKNGRYILNDGAALSAFANIPGNIKAEVRGGVAGLSTEVEGSIVRLKASADGIYRGVSIRVYDEAGGYYNSPAIDVVVDTSKPTIKIDSPASLGFVKEKFTVSGQVTDGSGIESLEYSVGDKTPAVVEKDGIVTDDGEFKWTSVTPSKAGWFSFTVDLTGQEDGYVPVSIRAKDTTGKVNVYSTAYFKDTTPPEVEVILPDAEAILNGENTIVFRVKDNGVLKTMSYRSSDGTYRKDFPWSIKAEPFAEDADPYLVSMNSSLPNMHVGVKGKIPLEQKMVYRFTDEAGNVTTLNNWEFTVDEKSDKPISEIHLPEENQVITTDFKISGFLYDDDGPCKVYYKIDNEKYRVVDDSKYAFNYEISVPLSAMTDNEHTISVYAVDVNGTVGNEVTRKFRISLEEPKGGMTEPEIGKTVKETVTLRGWASDKNGISKVQVSVDNGASYNDAIGTTNWSYTFDTRVIQDGTHVVFIKIWDGYGITGLYSSLITLDNTAPELNLELPLDDSKTTKNVFFSGQTTDNIGLTSLSITIRSLENKTIPSRLAKRQLEPDEIISQVLDISELENGFYNIELTGTDAAGNITRVSRNIQLDKSKVLTKAEMLYPLNGEHLQGEFNIYGLASSEPEDPVEKVELYLDGKKVKEIARTEEGGDIGNNSSAALLANGYFSFKIKGQLEPLTEGGEPIEVKEGTHKYRTKVITKAKKEIFSNEQTFVYNPYGPWVTLDDFTYGDFARNRPLLKGNAGYILTEEEKAALKDKKLSSEERVALEGKKIKRVYISFNNGKTYTPVSKKDKGEWSYRVENLDIPAGYHFMLIKAEMYNGENAITRTIVQVDRTAPSVKLISPGEGGHYNQQLEFSGLSGDDVKLKSVKLELRNGDKSSYEVPGFIQGLYFDVSVWGATLYNVGVGLTAFDNAVKIQVNFGQFTQEQRDLISDMFGKEHTDLRFGGNVFGAKIIAQIAYLPFRYFFGRDWDWLSASVSVGANFSYFTDSGASIVTGESVAQILSAALIQVEFPRITLSNASVFKTWSLYAEPQLWFIPSDIASDDAKKQVFTVSFGIRTSVF